MARNKRPPFHPGDRVSLASHVRTPIPSPLPGFVPELLRDTELIVSSVTGRGTLRDPWFVRVTVADRCNFWTFQPDDLVKAEVL